MRAHRQISAYCIGVASVAGSLAMAAEAIPTPSVSRIDYSHPEKYLDVFPSFGNVEKIRQPTCRGPKENPRRDKCGQPHPLSSRLTALTSRCREKRSTNELRTLVPGSRGSG